MTHRAFSEPAGMPCHSMPVARGLSFANGFLHSARSGAHTCLQLFACIQSAPCVKHNGAIPTIDLSNHKQSGPHATANASLDLAPGTLVESQRVLYGLSQFGASREAFYVHSCGPLSASLNRSPSSWQGPYRCLQPHPLTPRHLGFPGLDDPKECSKLRSELCLSSSPFFIAMMSAQ